MTDLLFDLLGLAYWAAIIGLVGWWVWRMKKASKPRRRTPREEAELAGLRAALERADRGTARPRH